MGIDYMIALDCEAKTALTIEGFVDMIKARSRAEVVLAMARRDGDTRPTSAITFQVHVLREGKVTATDASVQALFDQAAPLHLHRAGCAACPANRDREGGYGCYAGITYPIEADTEHWLLAQLPADLTSAPGYLFKSALADFAWDGRQARDMRSQGETFFRLREAPVRTWPSGLAVTGDQLFHMMFHVGHIASSHALMLGMFFGMVSLDEASRDQESPAAPESENARQMIEFLNTLAFAANHELEVLIDG
jgi:hypothetical protein